MRSTWEKVERKSKKGDQIVIDFTGRIDDELFEGGEGKEIAIVIGEGQVIEDMDKALIGLAAAESRSAKVKFPKDYHAANLAGKKAVFDISVHHVEQRVLPQVDDEFMEVFGVTEGGIEALRKEVRSNMDRELSERIMLKPRPTPSTNCLM